MPPKPRPASSAAARAGGQFGASAKPAAPSAISRYEAPRIRRLPIRPKSRSNSRTPATPPTKWALRPSPAAEGDNPNSSRKAGIAGPYSAWSAPMSTNPTQEATTAAGLKTGARAGASVEDMDTDVTGNMQAVKIPGRMESEDGFGLVVQCLDC